MPAKSPPFLMWYDDNPKLSVAHKIEEAIEAYADRLGVRPTLVLVNEAELTDFPGVAVRAMNTVRRNTFWVGQEDRPGAPIPIEAPIPPAPAPKATSSRRKAKATA
jgi:hypothetical protein